MKINKVTITGVDNKTPIIELEKLANDFPFVEWGVLFSTNHGKQRYPSLPFINELCDIDVKLSAHFCGIFANQILESNSFEFAFNLHEKFNSLQLNYNFKHKKKQFKFQYLLKIINTFNREIILQYNESNKETILNLALDIHKNLNILIDSSGGLGKEIKNISKPNWNNYTGFAGGLKIDNIVDIGKKIIDIDSSNNAWLDLESGVRTKNEFNISKVFKLLTLIEPYITCKK